MTIGLITPYYPDAKITNSGLATHFSSLASTLDALGHKVIVMYIHPAHNDGDKRRVENTDGNITTLTYNVRIPARVKKMLKKRWAVLDFLTKLSCMVVAIRNIDAVRKKYKVDVFETTSYFSLCYFYRFRNSAAPVIVRVSTTFLQMMDSYYPFKSRLMRAVGAMEINMIKRAPFLITHARGHAAELAQLYNIKQECFSIIPHGVSLPDIQKARSQDVTARLQVLYVGRFEYRKGIDTLLSAIPLVLKSHPDVHFELIGTDTDNEHQNKFRTQNSPGVNAAVSFTGLAADSVLQQAYRSCDIFVAPSRYESFGLIYIEAMSYGKPVIGCNKGGVTEIIQDGVNGLLVRSGDPAALADRLEILIKDQQFREMLGKNGRKTVEHKFSKEKLAAASVAYYQKAIAP